LYHILTELGVCLPLKKVGPIKIFLNEQTEDDYLLGCCALMMEATNTSETSVNF
jgi:hypothetical protein